MTRADRLLIARAWKWARTNGWSAAWDGYRPRMPRPSPRVELDDYGNHVVVAYVIPVNRPHGITTYRTEKFTAYNAQSALDWLVLVNVLPKEFSGMYQMGREAAFGDHETVHEWGTRFHFDDRDPFVSSAGSSDGAEKLARHRAGYGFTRSTGADVLRRAKRTGPWEQVAA